MTWTYTIPWTGDRDRIRSMIGDTDHLLAKLQDEEIDSYLALSPANIYVAAAQCCYAIAAKNAPRVSQSVVSSSIGADEIFRAYMALGDQLSQQGGAGAGGGAGVLTTIGVYAGGISQADKQANASNLDRVPPVFYRRQFSQPEEEAAWKP